MKHMMDPFEAWKNKKKCQKVKKKWEKMEQNWTYIKITNKYKKRKMNGKIVQ